MRLLMKNYHDGCPWPFKFKSQQCDKANNKHGQFDQTSVVGKKAGRGAVARILGVNSVEITFGTGGVDLVISSDDFAADFQQVCHPWPPSCSISASRWRRFEKAGDAAWCSWLSQKTDEPQAVQRNVVLIFLFQVAEPWIPWRSAMSYTSSNLNLVTSRPRKKTWDEPCILMGLSFKS